MKYIALFIIIFTVNNICNAQFYPVQNAHLNFSSICFKFPQQNNADKYVLRLYNNESSPFKSVESKANKIIVNDFEFGKSYFWKVFAYKGKESIFESPIMHFDIDSIINKAELRFVRTTYLKQDCSNELFVYDYAGMVLNRKTETQWFIPKNDNGVPISKGMRDLKLTRDGTFLALIDSMAYEFDLEGNILWQAPNSGEISKRNTEDYHHDIQKLENGNYIVLGNERVRAKFKGEKDSVSYESGFIVEYNREGKIVWLWRAKDFFTPELLALHRKEDGRVNPTTHMNSFQVDGNFIFVGFRDASWILKIDRFSKKVVELYGGMDSGFENHYAKGLFRFQHDTELLREGNSMAVINNDSIVDPTVVSSMLIFSLGDLQHEKGELLFRFPFNYDNKTSGKSQKMGNVTQLKNGNFLINMGSLNRVIEITPESKVVWDCFTEKLDSTKRYYHAFSHYRVSTCSSLYPNVFSVKPVIQNKTPGSIKLDLVITNVGSESQTYEVYALNKKGEIINGFHEQTNSYKSNETRGIQIESTDKHIVAFLIRAKGTGVDEVVSLYEDQK